MSSQGHYFCTLCICILSLYRVRVCVCVTSKKERNFCCLGVRMWRRVDLPAVLPHTTSQKYQIRKLHLMQAHTNERDLYDKGKRYANFWRTENSSSRYICAGNCARVRGVQVRQARTIESCCNSGESEQLKKNWIVFRNQSCTPCYIQHTHIDKWKLKTVATAVAVV